MWCGGSDCWLTKSSTSLVVPGRPASRCRGTLAASSTFCAAACTDETAPKPRLVVMGPTTAGPGMARSTSAMRVKAPGGKIMSLLTTNSASYCGDSRNSLYAEFQPRVKPTGVGGEMTL